VVRVCALQSTSLNLLAVGPTLAGLGEHGRTRARTGTGSERHTEEGRHNVLAAGRTTVPLLAQPQRPFSGEIGPEFKLFG
jgi:hypothetical protein